jgi:hypothetical protein
LRRVRIITGQEHTGSRAGESRTLRRRPIQRRIHLWVTPHHRHDDGRRRSGGTGREQKRDTHAARQPRFGKQYIGGGILAHEHFAEHAMDTGGFGFLRQ